MSDVVANSERSPRNGHWLRAVTDDVHSTTVGCEHKTRDFIDNKEGLRYTRTDSVTAGASVSGPAGGAWASRHLKMRS